MNERQLRRDFLEKLGIGTAGMLTAGYTATARGFAANETLNVGCIGTGGRCRQLMEALGELPGVKIVAICDIWDESIEKGRQLADPGAAITKYHEELLGRSDVDAVVIGAPDHLHVPLSIDACNAKKHVYCEKPLTHDLTEGQAIIEAQRRNNVIMQVGTQQRSMTQFQKAYEIVQSGVLGQIIKVHLTWNRNRPRAPKKKYGYDPKSLIWKRFLGSARDQPFDDYRFRHWRWFWDFGGGIFTDLMVHYIDVVHWLLDLDHPETATSIGSHFMKKGIWETPDTVQTLLRYPERDTQVYFEGTFSNARNGAMLEFMGTDATLYLDRGRYEVFPERKRKIKLKSDEFRMVLGTGPPGQDWYDEVKDTLWHVTNWVECVRSGKKPNAPVEVGVRSAAAAHMANQALRSGNVARWEALSKTSSET
jgi:predicted dehydrogenase